MMTGLQDKRVWLGGGAFLAVVILLIAWFMAISPQLSATSQLKTDSAAAQEQNGLLEAKIATLKRQNANVATLKSTLRTALAALPFDSGLPTFTRQLSTQATKSKVTLTDITVGAITATDGTTATTGAPAAAGGATLVAIPISVVSTGKAKSQLAFLAAIQVEGPRRALVTSSQLVPTGTSGAESIDAACTMTIQLSVFSAPLSAEDRAALKKILNGK